MANKRFKRQEYARYKKLGIKWRRPRGKTSKMRRYEAGKPDMPAIGYRTPRAIRDLHPSGYNDVLVHNMQELEDLDPAVDAARISASIGKRKKDLMLEKASEFIKKYERYEKRKSKINVHKPDCLSVNVGDSVKVAECRPLSKTKHFVLVEVKGE